MLICLCLCCLSAVSMVLLPLVVCLVSQSPVAVRCFCTLWCSFFASAFDCLLCLCVFLLGFVRTLCFSGVQLLFEKGWDGWGWGGEAFFQVVPKRLIVSKISPCRRKGVLKRQAGQRLHQNAQVHCPSQAKN
jgi:hypothetical protein